MTSLVAILQHAAGRFIDLVSPRPLLMILARGDAIIPSASIRSAFARAGEPKRRLETEGGHYTVYTGSGADTAAQAATEWFTEHLVMRKQSPIDHRGERDLAAGDAHGWSERNSQGNVVPRRRYRTLPLTCDDEGEFLNGGALSVLANVRMSRALSVSWRELTAITWITRSQPRGSLDDVISDR